MSKEIFLAIIVSVDTYLAAAAYCNSGIRIPSASSAVISLICASVLAVSIKFSDIIGNYIPSDICRICGLAIIVFIGLLTIVKSLVRTLIGHLSEVGEFSLKLHGSPLMLKLYLDDTAADLDNSKSLSAGEAAALALASSFDSAATGLSSGFSEIRPAATFIFAFICGFLAIFLGTLTGKKISSFNHDLSWVGGVLLIVFAIFQLF